MSKFKKLFRQLEDRKVSDNTTSFLTTDAAKTEPVQAPTDPVRKKINQETEKEFFERIAAIAERAMKTPLSDLVDLTDMTKEQRLDFLRSRFVRK